MGMGPYFKLWGVGDWDWAMGVLGDVVRNKHGFKGVTR